MRELTSKQDGLQAFETLRQLRPHLSLEEFQRLLALQTLAGYRLWGAFDDAGRLIGVLGARIVTTLARGTHLHIDDIVVDAGVRRRGVGKQLMSSAHAFAEENGCTWVFLDSRSEVIDFYGALNYEKHTATLMRKRIHRKAHK